MNKKAQAGLEYLVTYGWALVLVMTFVGVIVFIAEPTESAIWSTSKDFTVKSTTAGEANEASLILQNISGANITVTDVSLIGFGDSSNPPDGGIYHGAATLNSQPIRTGYHEFWPGSIGCDLDPPDPIEIKAGHELVFEGLDASTSLKNAAIQITYTDQFGFEKTVEFSFAKGSLETLSQKGTTHLCDRNYSPGAYYLYDFDSSQEVLESAGTGDLAKGNNTTGACCNLTPENGATQVDTGISSTQFDSVVCSPSDGRTYTTNFVSYSTPYVRVICLKTNEGKYVKYIGEASCCAGVILNWEVTHQ